MKKYKLVILVFSAVYFHDYNTVYSQDTNIVFNNIKCFDIRFDVINYKLSLYNVSYYFITQNNDTVIINRKCNYQTTGLYYDDRGRTSSRLFGFIKDSIYQIEIKTADCKELTNSKILYYSYVRFKKKQQSFNPKSFNPNKKIYGNSDLLPYLNSYVDIDNKLYEITYSRPIHFPPETLLPSKIYPFYVKDKHGNFMINHKFNGRNRYFRVTMMDDDVFILEYFYLSKDSIP